MVTDLSRNVRVLTPLDSLVKRGSGGRVALGVQPNLLTVTAAVLKVLKDDGREESEVVGNEASNGRHPLVWAFEFKEDEVPAGKTYRLNLKAKAPDGNEVAIFSGLTLPPKGAHFYAAPTINSPTPGSIGFTHSSFFAVGFQDPTSSQTKVNNAVLTYTNLGISFLGTILGSGMDDMWVASFSCPGVSGFQPVTLQVSSPTSSSNPVAFYMI